MRAYFFNKKDCDFLVGFIYLFFDSGNRSRRQIPGGHEYKNDGGELGVKIRGFCGTTWVFKSKLTTVRVNLKPLGC